MDLFRIKFGDDENDKENNRRIKVKRRIYIVMLRPIVKMYWYGCIKNIK